MTEADNKTKILIMLPVAFAIVILFLGTNITFENGLSSTEQGVLDFEYRQLNIEDKKSVAPVDILEGPLEFDRTKTAREIPESSELEVFPDNSGVSLIVISGDSKMAIVHGMLVKEGDKIDDNKVVKIESDRVLLRNKINQWLYLKNED